MKRFAVCLSVICTLIGLLSITTTAGQGLCGGGSRLSAEATSASVINIKVSPNTIVLKSVGEWVTVHTDIALSLVDTSTLSLNGVEVAWTKADAKGYLVAKFTQASIKAIVESPEATLQLRGFTKGGVEFTGSDTVGVR